MMGVTRYIAHNCLSSFSSSFCHSSALARPTSAIYSLSNSDKSGVHMLSSVVANLHTSCQPRAVHPVITSSLYQITSLNQSRSNSTLSRSKVRTDFKRMVDRMTANSCHLEKGSPFIPRKVLILNKFTRLDYEKEKDSSLSKLNPDQLVEELVKRGGDRKALEDIHERNSITRRNTEHLIDSLQKSGCQVKVVSRFEYTKELIDWADMIVTSGGDGTFLMAASKVCGDKPIIGFNSDPQSSVGHLLLQGKYTENFPLVLENLRTGSYHWMKRVRIKTTLIGKDAWCEPMELHQQQMNHRHKYGAATQKQSTNTKDHISTSTGHCRSLSGRIIELENPNGVNFDHHDGDSRILPILALNEVFIGESLSGRVSYIDIAVGKLSASIVHTKSSGLAICTGTGSTSWSYNINKITGQTVSELLDFAAQETTLVPDISEKLNARSSHDQSKTLADRIAERFNSTLVFDPTQPIMQYTLRDPVTFPTYPPRGRTDRIEVVSHMQDACVVIDGGPSYSFNSGTSAVFEVNPSDSLLTIKLPD